MKGGFLGKKGVCKPVALLGAYRVCWLLSARDVVQQPWADNG